MEFFMFLRLNASVLLTMNILMENQSFATITQDHNDTIQSKLRRFFYLHGRWFASSCRSISFRDISSFVYDWNSFVLAKTRQNNCQNAQNPGEVIFCKLCDPEEIIMKHLATSLDKKLIPPSGLFCHSHKYKFYWVYYIRCKLN